MRNQSSFQKAPQRTVFSSSRNDRSIRVPGHRVDRTEVALESRELLLEHHVVELGLEVTGRHGRLSYLNNGKVSFTSFTMSLHLHEVTQHRTYLRNNFSKSQQDHFDAGDRTRL